MRNSLCYVAFAMLLALNLSACVTGDYSKVELGGKKIPEIYQGSFDDALSVVSNKTFRMGATKSHYSPGSSVLYIKGRIFFFAEDGQGYWWDIRSGGTGLYRASSGYEVVHFTWKLKSSENRYDLCIVFPEIYSLTYGSGISLTRGTFECFELGGFASDVAEAAPGDVFKLSKRRIPFLRSDDEMTFQKIRQKIDSAN